MRRSAHRGVFGCRTASDSGRLLIDFDEFSANLTQKTRTTLADAARRAQEEKAKGSESKIGQATGSQLTNHYLAMTRAEVVADELAKDGLEPGTLFKEPQPVGKTS